MNYSVSCGSPIIPGNGFIEAYQNTLEGAEIFFKCDSGFVPAGRMTAVSGVLRHDWKTKLGVFHNFLSA